MSTDHDFDRLADAWMAEGPFDLADPVLERAFDEVHRTRQRRPLVRPWRIQMSNRTPLALALVAIVAIGGLVVAGLGRTSDTVGTTDPSTHPGVASSVPLATATPGPAATLAPMGYSGAGTIAFSRLEPAAPGTQTTWTVDPAGTNETPLRVTTGFGGATTLPGTACCTVFSPDGSTVAVGFDDVNPGGGTLTRTALLGLDGSLLEHLPRCGGCGSIDGMNYVPVAWSAQGNHLALRAWSDADPSKNGVYLVEVGRPRGSQYGWDPQVTGDPRDLPLEFSPDGGRLLFVRVADGYDDRGDLYVLDLASRSTTRLTPAGVVVMTNGYFGPGASWSPDGTKVAYAGTDASGSTSAMQVSIVPAGGGDAVAISDPGRFITSARWSPDGNRIAWDAEAGGFGHDLFVSAPDGSGRANLTADFPPGVCCARWSPDSRTLLVAGTTGDNDHSVLYAVPADGSTIHQVTTIPGIYQDFTWGTAVR